jgi:hypothetical protein
MFAARQEEATVKRIKLEYDEIGSCVREVMEVWDLLVSKESRVSTQCDSKMLLQAIRQGETYDLLDGTLLINIRQINKYKIKLFNFICGLFPFLAFFIFSFHSNLFSQSQSSIRDLTLSIQHLNWFVLTHVQKAFRLKCSILHCVIIKFVFSIVFKLLNSTVNYVVNIYLCTTFLNNCLYTVYAILCIFMCNYLDTIHSYFSFIADYGKCMPESLGQSCM